MDVFIKRKNYEEITQYLTEISSDSDWKIFLDSLTSSEELLNYVKDFLASIKCPFKLKLFLLKISTYNIKNKKYQEIVYDIIIYLISSKSELNSHINIQNLVLIQIVKISMLDETNQIKLSELILSRPQGFDDWFLEILDRFHFNKELGLYYESINNNEMSLEYYTRCGMQDKVDEIRNKMENTN